jgi:3-hydroxyisobutyrate dehydrogenase-like beta-hydroxyacid dehydrogenase
MTTVALIGCGEVGRHFARDLVRHGATVTAYDIAPAARLRDAPVQWHDTPQIAVAGAELVIVAVTAGSALAAARSLDGALGHAPFVLDVNSVSPATKAEDAAAITASGGRYVEAAVMTSVPPHGLVSPMLLGGPHRAAFMRMAEPWGMRLTSYSDRIGAASSVKMCRSVMIKGLEALSTECLLTARHYGVERDVLASLGDTLPHEDWSELARYMIGRALVHGRRRAEEMREVARTVADAGVEPLLSSAIAQRQDWAADRGAAMGGRLPGDLPGLLDSIIDRPKAAE